MRTAEHREDYFVVNSALFLMLWMLASLEQDSLFKYSELKLIAPGYDIHLINKNPFEKMLTY